MENTSPGSSKNIALSMESYTRRRFLVHHLKDFDVPYSHFKVFGCKTFMHAPKEQRSKLDDKATPCIFIGYGDEEFGYRLWDLEKQKIVRSKDILFHEHETIEDMEKNVRGEKLTYEGVADLTLGQISSQSATNEVKMSE